MRVQIIMTVDPETLKPETLATTLREQWESEEGVMRIDIREIVPQKTKSL